MQQELGKKEDKWKLSATNTRYRNRLETTKF